MYLPVPVFEPMSSVFLGGCVTHLAAVSDTSYHHIMLSFSGLEPIKVRFILSVLKDKVSDKISVNPTSCHRLELNLQPQLQKTREYQTSSTN